VMDVQLKPEHATPTTVQEIVNGDHIQNGVTALRHAMEALKIGLGCYNKLH